MCVDDWYWIICARDVVALITASAASPPVFTRPDRMQSTRQRSLVVGDSARLRCEARASPTPEVVWYKDDVTLADKAPHLTTWTLELDHVTKDDDGIYTCAVYNHVGVITFSYNITVTSIDSNCCIFLLRVFIFYINFPEFR